MSDNLELSIKSGDKEIDITKEGISVTSGMSFFYEPFISKLHINRKGNTISIKNNELDMEFNCPNEEEIHAVFNCLLSINEEI